MWNSLIVPIGMGLIIMLTGMKILEWSLQLVADHYLRTLLLRVTRTPWRGLLTGTVMTAITQSSTAITVIAIGLVHAGAMTYGQTLGLLLGANIGTCLTTELVSWHIQPVAWPLLISSAVVGVGLLFVQKYRVIRTICFAMSGFSGVLIGIAMMQSITPWLIDHGMFQAFVLYAHQNVLAGILSGAIMAAVLHSSAATIAIAMSLAGAGALSLPLAIAIVLGANIGTCATGLLAAIGASRPAQLVAYSQLVLNVSGTLLFIPLIEPLQTLVQHLTTNPASQVAHAQTIFNVVCSLLALPLCYLPVFQRSKK